MNNPRVRRWDSFDWAKLTPDQRMGRVVAAVRVYRDGLEQSQVAEAAGKTRAALAKAESRGFTYWLNPWPLKALNLPLEQTRALCTGTTKLEGVRDLRTLWRFLDEKGALVVSRTGGHQAKSHKKRPPSK